MKKKNNYPMPDALEGYTNVVSSNDFTGLIPASVENETEQTSHMYQVPPQVK